MLNLIMFYLFGGRCSSIVCMDCCVGCVEIDFYMCNIWIDYMCIIYEFRVSAFDLFDSFGWYPVGFCVQFELPELGFCFMYLQLAVSLSFVLHEWLCCWLLRLRFILQLLFYRHLGNCFNLGRCLFWYCSVFSGLLGFVLSSYVDRTKVIEALGGEQFDGTSVACCVCI